MVILSGNIGKELKLLLSQLKEINPIGKTSISISWLPLHERMVKVSGRIGRTDKLLSLQLRLMRSEKYWTPSILYKFRASRFNTVIPERASRFSESLTVQSG